jgi:GlpG protein
MRLIGHLDNDKDARTFADFLYVQGIPTDTERDNEKWAIWVHEEEQLGAAKKLLDEFRTDPSAKKFQAGSPAEKLRQKAETENKAYRKRQIDGRTASFGLRQYGFGPVTYTLIIASIVVAVLSSLGQHKERIASLFIEQIYVDGSVLSGADRNFEAIRHGEVWRLVTPIIIHFGIFHILFNMMWLRDLGSLFEARLGSWYFAVFVLIVAVISNVAQYVVSHHPIFGGMSGVVYGLIGYAWIRGRFDPAAGIGLDKQTVIYAIVWFVLCFTNLLGPIANWAHAGGLAVGMGWAYIDAKRR